ncbi:serine/threonine/tyrosine-interacting-like protein 1 [Stylophora pistillata]|uniref:protein-tyrosine-phosphatase n=1 Tax=Stylophora pistillata TaxID=50429 RepID=A0A2B4RWS3_STYPI|nr:serine/threonine/tyrosine-interacting-like protein 1 [Stylophora pistillata]PFX20695.1 Serine/threonine/tyrosine-interacting-like protein 1 [Stylophora pistillata]
MSKGILLLECPEFYNILNQAGKYPRLSDPNYLLLLDTRQRHDYSESHIITAKFAPRNDIGAFLVPYEAELQTKEHVVIYDSNTFSLKDKNSTALSCAKLMWDMGRKNPVKVIKGGYEDFSRLYPFLRTQKIIYMTRELDVINTYPVEVIPGFLYLSTFQQSQDKKIIKDLKVKANVIVAKETDKIFAPESTTLGKGEKRVKQILNLPVDDSGKEDIYSQLTDVVNFIDDHDNKDGRTVLLTSTLGISRSVTVAIAYYIWNKKVSLKDAYNHLKKCRENMQPTRGFIEQLSSWEEKIFGSKVTDITEPEY